MNDWHYAKDRGQHGPVSEEELRGLVERRELDDDDLVWHRGMAKWERVDESDVFAAARAKLAAPVFFPVSVTKLVLMSIVTFSVYLIYWMYKQWEALREREDNWPVVRAVFGVLWCYPLFRAMREVMRERGYEPRYPAGPCAILFVISNFLWRLPDPWFWAGFLIIPPVAFVASDVLRFHAQVAPRADRNARFSGWNILGLVVGGLWLLLAIVGSTME